MKKQDFEITADYEYIQLNNLLKTLQLVQTGGHAKIVIQNGEVQVNGGVELQVRKKLYRSDIVIFNQNEIHII